MGTERVEWGDGKGGPLTQSLTYGVPRRGYTTTVQYELVLGWACSHVYPIVNLTIPFPLVARSGMPGSRKDGQHRIATSYKYGRYDGARWRAASKKEARRGGERYPLVSSGGGRPDQCWSGSGQCNRLERTCRYM